MIKELLKTVNVKITLTEEMLGMCAQKDVHEKFIASKAPDAASREEEVEALGVSTVVGNMRTIFPREEGVPFMWDYQIKGFFKDSCKFMRRVPGTHSSTLTSYKQLIDGCMFPGPRRIMFKIPDKAKIGNCQRPLRAETAQGPRVALADSETVPAGTVFEFEVKIMEPTKKKGVSSLEDCLIEWLEYGELRGLGQWRNSGKGKFEFKIA